MLGAGGKHCNTPMWLKSISVSEHVQIRNAHGGDQEGPAPLAGNRAG